MRKVLSLIILGLLLLGGGNLGVRAAAPTSDWPSLNADAAQSNANLAEKTLSARNVLKLKPRWTVPLPEVSYPIVAGGRVYVPFVTRGKVHVHALDAASGKLLATYPKDALGGLLMMSGDLYLTGHILQAVDPSSGSKVGQVAATPALRGGTFINPVADSKVIVAGYASSAVNAPASLYAVDPISDHVLWKVPSASADGAIGTGRILTRIASGAVFYDESTGKQVAARPRMDSDWFAGPDLAYTVAAAGKQKATIYALDRAGKSVWKRVVGPPMVTTNWPHAVGPSALYVETWKPRSGVEALDPATGKPLWNRPIANIQKLAWANNLLFVLTYGLGQPVRLIVLHADTGGVIGSLVLSSGYFVFPAANDLMVASGMVFIRAVGPTGQQLVALGP